MNFYRQIQEKRISTSNGKTRSKSCFFFEGDRNTLHGFCLANFYRQKKSTQHVYMFFPYNNSSPFQKINRPRNIDPHGIHQNAVRGGFVSSGVHLPRGALEALVCPADWGRSIQYRLLVRCSGSIFSWSFPERFLSEGARAFPDLRTLEKLKDEASH